MDRNKKIIVGAVGLIMITALLVAIKFILSSEDEQQKMGISISIPSVDEKKIEAPSKIEKYDKEPIDSIEGMNMDAAENIFSKKQKTDNPFARSAKKDEYIMDDTDGLTQQNDKEQEEMELQLQEIMSMQEQMQMQEQIELQKQLALYQQMGLNNQANQNQLQYLESETINPEQITAVARQQSEKIVSPLSKLLKEKDHFHGAIQNTKDKVLDLIPSETVDQGFIVNGSTIAIRTKKEMKLQDLQLTIPKDAILYGKVSFNGTNRLGIDIASYTTNTKLYRLKMEIYDFDGRKGVHLGNRTWSKIPSSVTNDVYDYAYTRGTQGSTFGGGENSEIKLEEAKKIALLSASKEISKEIFDKRKVLMPRKYHLWINLQVEQ